MQHVDSMGNDGRYWHDLAQALWVVALFPSVGCGETGSDDSSNSRGNLTDAQVVDGNRGNDDSGATGSADSSTADDTDLGIEGSADRDADDRTFWNDDSVAIDFTLRGPVAQVLCAFSATRDELTTTQIEGLSSLTLHDPQELKGCDVYNYEITVHGRAGSSKNFQATDPACAGQPLVLFNDFEAWAQSTPCSASQSH